MDISIDMVADFTVFASSLQPLNPRLRGERLLGYRVRLPATEENDEETVQVLKYNASHYTDEGLCKPYFVVYLDGPEQGSTMWEEESEFDGAMVVSTPAVQPEVRGNDLVDYMLSFPSASGVSGSPVTPVYSSR